MPRTLRTTRSTDAAAVTVPAPTVPRATWYLAIEGTGDPKGMVFHDRLAALDRAQRTLRAAAKKHGITGRSGELEVQLWRATSADGSIAIRRWRLLMQVPPATTAAAIREAGERLAAAARRMPLVGEVQLVLVDEAPRQHHLHAGRALAARHAA